MQGWSNGQRGGKNWQTKKYRQSDKGFILIHRGVVPILRGFVSILPLGGFRLSVVLEVLFLNPSLRGFVPILRGLFLF